MSSLKIPLRLDQREIVGKELDRLFVLQDRPFGESKKQVFLDELEDSGLPFAAIVSGIRALADKDPKTLKLFVIKESIVTFVNFEREKTSCIHCRGTGIVSMVRDGGYRFALACTCSTGRSMDKEFIRWNGSVHQDVNGHHYALGDFVLLGDRYYDWLKSNGLSETSAVEPGAPAGHQAAPVWAD